MSFKIFKIPTPAMLSISIRGQVTDAQNRSLSNTEEKTHLIEKISLGRNVNSISQAIFSQQRLEGGEVEDRLYRAVGLL